MRLVRDLMLSAIYGKHLMPKIIDYGPSKVTSVVPSANQRGAFPSATFGVPVADPGSVGRSLSNLGSSIGNFVDQVDTTRAEEAVVNFERDKNALLYTSEDAYFKSKGKGAFDNEKPVKEELLKIRRAYADGLRSGNSRAMFGKATDSMITRSDVDITSHSVRQFSVWRNQTISLQIENTLENASIFANDPERLALERELGHQSILDRAIAAFGEEEITDIVKEDTETYDSAFSVAIIESLMVDSAVWAESKFEELKETIEGPSRRILKEKIKDRLRIEKGRDDSSQAVIIANDLVDTYRHADQPLAQMERRLKEDYADDGDLQAKVRREMTTQYNIVKAEISEERASIYKAAAELLQKGDVTIDQLIGRNVQSWLKMTDTQRRQLISGAEPITDFTVYSELRLRSPKELAKVLPSDYVHLFARSDLDKLQTAVEAAKRGDNSVRVGQSQIAQVSQLMLNLGLGTPATRNKKETERANILHSLIDGEANYRKEELGRELTSKEFTEIVDGFYRVDVMRPRKLFPGSRIFENQRITRKVPEEHIDRLVEFLHDIGSTVNTSNLIIAYDQLKDQLEDQPDTLPGN